MSLLRKFIALLLLALWLPATQHCGLEAAGLMAADAHGVETECCATSESCTHDGCDLVESSWVKTSDHAIKVPAPVLADHTYFLSLQLLPTILTVRLAPAVSEPEQPEHWVPVWQFVRRAAPLSRAPSVVG